jgi:S-layer protein
LAATAVFQDYANAVVNAGGDSSTNGHIGWFQFGGDTYIVEGLNNAITTPNFANSSATGDIVVKLTGLVDLSHTSLNTTGAPTLLIG